MAQSNALAADVPNPDSDSGVRERRAMHPLLIAIENAPLDPISDEKKAELDEIFRTTTHWLTDEEFVAAVGLNLK